jgi:hypothetical protein
MNSLLLRDYVSMIAMLRNDDQTVFCNNLLTAN